MTLEELKGVRLLSGVDFGTVPVDDPQYTYGDANSMTFVLDGHAYYVVEDPRDGHRSSMRDIVEVPIDSVKNRFAPVCVLGRHREKGDRGNAADVLELIDIVTTRVVLEVGTDNNDWYYPLYVANFRPEDMACNQPVSVDVVSGATDLPRA